MNQNNLESFSVEAGLKTPVSAIEAESRNIIAGFLETEQEYRKQHKIKRLLRQSGIKHVKPLHSLTGSLTPGSARRIFSLLPAPHGSGRHQISYL